MAEEFGLDNYLCDGLMAFFTDNFISDQVLLQASDYFEQLFNDTPATILDAIPSASSSDTQQQPDSSLTNMALAPTLVDTICVGNKEEKW